MAVFEQEGHLVLTGYHGPEILVRLLGIRPVVFEQVDYVELRDCDSAEFQRIARRLLVFRELEVLVIYGTPNGEGTYRLSALRELTKLRKLSIDLAKADDRLVYELVQLRTLTHVELPYGSTFSAEALQELKRRLPKCTVEGSNGEYLD